MRGVFLFFSLLILITSCAVEKKDSTTVCVQDSDCLPASCCHATDAVNQQSAPDCSKIFCTEECVPQTMDCGQGEVKCVNNQCMAVIS